MKTILIFSDTHGDTDRCIHIINGMERKPDMIIHAGDHARDAEDLASIYPDIPIHYVCGNCDMFSNAQSHIILKAENATIFVTHGHEFNVKYELHYTTLERRAALLGADLCVFGHTHIPYTDHRGKMTILNPGSLRYGGTYAIAEINNGKVLTTIKEY